MAVGGRRRETDMSCMEYDFDVLLSLWDEPPPPRVSIPTTPIVPVFDLSRFSSSAFFVIFVIEEYRGGGRRGAHGVFLFWCWWKRRPAEF